MRLAGTEGTPALAASTKKNLEAVAPIVRPIVRLAKMASAIFTARLLGQQAWQLKRKLVERHSIVQHAAGTRPDTEPRLVDHGSCPRLITLADHARTP